MFVVFQDGGDCYNFCGIWDKREDAYNWAKNARANSEFQWSLERYFIIEIELNKEFTDEQHEEIGYSEEGIN